MDERSSVDRDADPFSPWGGVAFLFVLGSAGWLVAGVFYKVFFFEGADLLGPLLLALVAVRLAAKARAAARRRAGRSVAWIVSVAWASLLGLSMLYFLLRPPSPYPFG